MVAIGTWNLENFFPPGGASGPTTQAAYDAKLAALAAAIRSLSPDVLAVQEVGDPAALENLAKALADEGYAFHATARRSRRARDPGRAPVAPRTSRHPPSFGVPRAAATDPGRRHRDQ